MQKQSDSCLVQAMLFSLGLAESQSLAAAYVSLVLTWSSYVVYETCLHGCLFICVLLLLCYIVCVIILSCKHRFAPCTPCLLKLCKPRKRTCFWRNATSKVTTGPDYAITIRMALYIKQVSGRFHSFHYVLVILMNRCRLKLNIVCKVVIIYI